MSEITSLYVHKVLEHAAPEVFTADLLERIGMGPDAPIDPKKMISSDAYYQFFADLSIRDPFGPTLPLRIGATMRIDDYGAFGLAWKSAPSLRGSYTRSERYGRVLGRAEVYTIEETNDGWFFSLEKAGPDGLGMMLSNEASMSAVNVLSKEVSTAPFRPLAVFFKHAPRGEASIYEDHFDCPVHFNSSRDALLVSASSIDAPNRLGDETIARFFDQHLEQELASLGDTATLEHEIRRVVTKLLSDGVPSLLLIASELGMGTRTLQRRLAESGQSFQSLVDLARKELAQNLLRDTQYSLAEIAFLTGFSEQSGFTRAFKRWAGQTPRSYRLDAMPSNS